jgi:hypothetical protein
MSRVHIFTQTQVQKVLRAAKSEGYEITSLEVDREGKIVARFGNDNSEQKEASDWDALISGKKHRASA